MATYAKRGDAWRAQVGNKALQLFPGRSQRKPKLRLGPRNKMLIWSRGNIKTCEF